jgi:mRNA interferase RelE/StbE
MSDFSLLYHPQALKRLQKIHPRDQKKIIKKIEILCKDTFNPQLDIRKLAGTTQSYRLRVGNLRIIYEIDTNNNNIYIWEIDYRGNIY